MAAFRIRRARRSDLPALLVLEQRTFTSDLLSERQFRKHIDSDSAVVLAAVEGDALLGDAVVFFRITSTSAHLYSIAVSEKARGRGVGEAIVRAVERTARDRDCTHLRLEVRQDNHGAIRLYERLGYQRIRARPHYYEDGADAWRYEKALSTRR